MISIKFSHMYEKMLRDFWESQLIGVLPVKLEDLSKGFLQYDTAYLDGGELRNYELPKTGDYMILLLIAGSGKRGLWTTIRRRTPEKEAYYRRHIGDLVFCDVME